MLDLLPREKTRIVMEKMAVKNTRSVKFITHPADEYIPATGMAKLHSKDRYPWRDRGIE
jgi:hypothetical protein